MSAKKMQEKEKSIKCIHPRVIDKPHSALGLVVCLDCGLMFWPENMPLGSYRSLSLPFIRKKEKER